MKWILLIAVLLLSACSFTSTATPTPLGRLMFGLMIQEPDEYPQGWKCTPRGINKNGRQTNEAPCHCVTVIHDDLCEGDPTEHSLCNQYCHWKKQKCACPVTCEMPK